MTLRGERLRLRPIVEPDLERVAEIESDEEGLGLMDDGPVMPRRADRLATWLIEPYGKHDAYPFGVERLDDGTLAGTCNLHAIDRRVRSAEVGISMARETWGTGLGTEAVRLLVGWGFAELNLHRIWLTVWEHNPRARRSYEKLGFVEEGRLPDHLWRDGRWLDAVVMAVLRSEWSG